MRLKTLLKTMLLLCALIVGSGSAWAAESTWTWTASSGALGTKTPYSATLNGKAWTVTRSSVVYTGWSSSCIQMGSSSGAENVTLSSSAFEGNVIKSVSVECSSYSGKHNVAISVGGNSYLASTATSSWTTVSTKTGTGTSEGEIVISFTAGSNARALYIKSITVVYEPAVSASPLASISVDASGSKTSYNVGETFSHDGVAVTATYADNSTKDVTNRATFSSPTMSTTGDKTVTVSYTEGEITKTDTYTINVHEYQQPTSFDIELNNSFFGTNFNGSASGITDSTPKSGTKDNVTVTYAGSGDHYINNTHIRIYNNNKLTFAAPSGYVVTNIVFTPGSSWANTITISANSGEYTSSTKTWEGEANSVVFTASGSGSCYLTKATITLAVEKNLTSIALSGTYPTTFVEGAAFSHEGLVVTATYEDNSTKVVTNDATFSTPNMTQIGSQTVTVTYKNKTATYTINISEKQKHNVKFYNNGQEITASAAQVKEGEAITFPEAPTAVVAGYEFLGWATAAIDGVAQNAPTTVTSANMGTADVNYYAVYANVVRTNITATFDASDISNLTSTGTRKWSDNATGIELYISNGQRYTNGTPNTWTVTKSTSSADYCLTIGKSGINIKGVRVTVSETDYAVGDYYAYATTEDENGEDLTPTVTTNGTESTWNLSGNYELVALWSSTSNQIRATLIEVEAEDNVISGYRTTISVNATVGAKGYATMVNSEHALDFTGKSISAYIVKSTDGSALTLTKVNKIAKNTPVLLYSTTNSDSQAIPVIADSETMDDVTGNKLERGNGDAITWSDSFKVYVLNTTNTPGFYKANASPVATNKAYLNLTGLTSGGSRSFFTLNFDDATAIENVNLNDNLNGEVYDLQGRRVATPQKGGLYIMNGKKVVIK